MQTAVRQLDRVIDLNFYPIATARASNMRWRPVGLGVMGLQDVFFQMRLAFDSPQAKELSTRIAETIYFHALRTSMELARELGRTMRSRTRGPRRASCSSIAGVSRRRTWRSGMRCAMKSKRTACATAC